MEIGGSYHEYREMGVDYGIVDWGLFVRRYPLRSDSDEVRELVLPLSNVPTLDWQRRCNGCNCLTGRFPNYQG